MKRTSHQAMRGWSWAAVVAALVAGALAAQAAYVELPNGKRFEGSAIRATATGDVYLTTPQGVMTFTKGQYIRAMADRPAELDQAAQLIRAKKYDEGIKLLEGVANAYRFLEWDVQARAALAQAQAEKGDAMAAVTTFEKIFSLTPQAKSDGAILWGYRQALLGAKQYARLKPLLDEVIVSGSRDDAARAQTMRGDIEAAQGNMELAVLDYLRTVVLFKNQKDAQPEALFKAAEALDKLRDGRAKQLYTQLAADYPSSPYAAQARAKAQ